MLLGGLEAGGTKMVCAISDENFDIKDSIVVPTETPETTMGVMLDFFKAFEIKALGIGSFGPVDLNKNSDTYGSITSTPKLPWQNFAIYNTFKDALNLPVLIDTDVNAAALAESQLGAAKGLDNCIYVTVGTGIGGGLVIERNLVHGLVHPEMGHMLMRPMADDPMPGGACPFHDGCLEGLASGTAMTARWGEACRDFDKGHLAWRLESDYLAQMCVNLILLFSPEKIVLGGGVMQQAHLFDAIRQKVLVLLGGYVKHPVMEGDLSDYIVAPGLGTKSGITGALMLAKRALESGK